MDVMTSSAIGILEKLLSFKTISALPNRDFIAYVEDYLRALGVQSHLSFDDSGERANLHALVGPHVDGGVVLNGHTDVVPVTGQNWTSDPFTLSQRDGRLYGRGAVDMKGYLACMLAAIPLWQKKPLKRPIHISMCYDEEIGGFGAPILVDDIQSKGPQPAIAIVGEPTQMAIVTGHKGGYELHSELTGLSTHSSDPAKGVNAIEYAAKFIAHQQIAALDIAKAADPSSPYDPPHCTINVGKISGGSARNAVAGSCSFDWEIRPLPQDNGDEILADILKYADEVLLPQMRQASPQADFETQVLARVPALDENQAGEAAALIGKITGINSTSLVAFATDAGHFCNSGISTAVFGPGNINRAHKADEYITTHEITDCLNFFDQLADHLSA